MTEESEDPGRRKTAYLRVAGRARFERSRRQSRKQNDCSMVSARHELRRTAPARGTGVNLRRDDVGEPFRTPWSRRPGKEALPGKEILPQKEAPVVVAAPRPSRRTDPDNPRKYLAPEDRLMRTGTMLEYAQSPP